MAISLLILSAPLTMLGTGTTASDVNWASNIKAKAIDNNINEAFNAKVE
jgi:hypothetical protein